MSDFYYGFCVGGPISGKTIAHSRKTYSMGNGGHSFIGIYGWYDLTCEWIWHAGMHETSTRAIPCTVELTLSDIEYVLDQSGWLPSDIRMKFLRAKMK